MARRCYGPAGPQRHGPIIVATCPVCRHDFLGAEVITHILCEHPSSYLAEVIRVAERRLSPREDMQLHPDRTPQLSISPWPGSLRRSAHLHRAGIHMSVAQGTSSDASVPISSMRARGRWSPTARSMAGPPGGAAAAHAGSLGRTSIGETHVDQSVLRQGMPSCRAVVACSGHLTKHFPSKLAFAHPRQGRSPLPRRLEPLPRRLRWRLAAARWSIQWGTGRRPWRVGRVSPGHLRGGES
jgi:hypothetical protein